jgi:hypothetical protein
VQGERDAADEEDDDREGEPHVTKIGNMGVRVKSLRAGKG